MKKKGKRDRALPIRTTQKRKRDDHYDSGTEFKTARCAESRAGGEQEDDENDGEGRSGNGDAARVIIPRGIINEGVSCYLNVVIQYFSASMPHLRGILTMNTQASPCWFGDVLKLLQSVLKQVSRYSNQTERDPLSLKVFCERSGLPYLDLEDHSQEDPTEVRQF